MSVRQCNCVVPILCRNGARQMKAGLPHPLVQRVMQLSFISIFALLRTEPPDLPKRKRKIGGGAGWGYGVGGGVGPRTHPLARIPRSLSRIYWQGNEWCTNAHGNRRRSLGTLVQLRVTQAQRSSSVVPLPNRSLFVRGLLQSDRSWVARACNRVAIKRSKSGCSQVTVLSSSLHWR